MLLLAGAPIHDVLPVVAAPDGSVPRCDGWTLVPKLTLCVVDGPGEHGLVVPALVAPVLDATQGSAEPGGMADWCTDAERAGGAVVLSLETLPEELDWPHLLGSGVAHGGFVQALA